MDMLPVIYLPQHIRLTISRVPAIGAGSAGDGSCLLHHRIDGSQCGWDGGSGGGYDSAFLGMSAAAGKQANSDVSESNGVRMSAQHGAQTFH